METTTLPERVRGGALKRINGKTVLVWLLEVRESTVKCVASGTLTTWYGPSAAVPELKLI